ncbi:MAG: hypothetical protein WCJ11_00855 [Methylococcaceae bacterium]
MPRLIEHIDAIGRKKQRDVLMLEFHPEFKFHIGNDDEEESESYDYRKDKTRAEILENLIKLNIPWVKCATYASTNMMSSYQGQIYIDVPYDENLPIYQILQEYLEFSDGSIRFPSVKFLCLTLECCMQNAHHDELGFWEKWADNF